jgi:hypothetical protein
VSPGWWDRRKR